MRDYIPSCYRSLPGGASLTWSSTTTNQDHSVVIYTVVHSHRLRSFLVQITLFLSMGNFPRPSRLSNVFIEKGNRPVSGTQNNRCHDNRHPLSRGYLNDRYFGYGKSLSIHCAGRIGKVSGGFWKVLFPKSCKNLTNCWISSPKPPLLNQFSYRYRE